MSTGKLYEEAINEANDLVRMAEERARDKLIESVMPRIRSLLEKRILEGDDDVSDTDADDLLLGGFDEDDEDETDGEEMQDIAPVLQPQIPPLPPMPSPVAPAKSADEDETVEIKIPKETSVKVSVQETEADPVGLDESMIKNLVKLVDGRGTLSERAKVIQLELKMLRRELDALSGHGKKLRAGDQLIEGFNAILRKSIGLKQEIKDSVPGPLAESAKQELIKIEKEITEMSTKTLLRSLLSESLEETEVGMPEMKVTMEDDDAGDKPEGDDLVSADEEPAGDDMDMEVEDVDMGALKSALKTFADALGMEVVDDEEDAGEEDANEGAACDEYGNPIEETIYEIDESVLRTELQRLRGLREAKSAGAAAMAKDFGGGDAGKDLFTNPPKLNANESGKVRGRGRPVKEAEGDDELPKKEEVAETVNESRRNRELQAKLVEATKAVKVLDRQLAEQKLFNAKLLYVNKLMQSSSLTDKQFRSIVEALDSAKNLREAHLLYTSLSESLSKTGRSITEGSKNVGGSSRPVATASAPLNEAVVVDRWAILAGIKK